MKDSILAPRTLGEMAIDPSSARLVPVSGDVDEVGRPARPAGAGAAGRRGRSAATRRARRPELDEDPYWRLVAAFLVECRRAQTRRAYLTDLKACYAWCVARELHPLRARRQDVALWARQERTRLAPGGLRSPAQPGTHTVKITGGFEGDLFQQATASAFVHQHFTYVVRVGG